MIIIYSKPNCIFCDKAKALMTEKGLTYKENVIGEDVSISWIKEAFPSMTTVPIIVYNNHLVGGYDRLVEKFAYTPNWGKNLLLG